MWQMRLNLIWSKETYDNVPHHRYSTRCWNFWTPCVIVSIWRTLLRVTCYMFGRSRVRFLTRRPVCTDSRFVVVKKFPNLYFTLYHIHYREFYELLLHIRHYQKLAVDEKVLNRDTISHTHSKVFVCAKHCKYQNWEAARINISVY